MNTTIKASDLMLAVKACQHAIPSKDVRYYLNGLRIEVSDVHVLFVATDGHRLAGVQTYAVEPTPAPESFELVIDADQIGLLVKWLQPFTKMNRAQATLSYEKRYMDNNPAKSAIGGRVTVECMGSTLVLNARPHDEKFPDWRRVMPKDIELRDSLHSSQDFNASYLADVGKAAALFNAKYGQCKVRLLPGQGVVTADNGDGVSFTEVIMGMRELSHEKR